MREDGDTRRPPRRAHRRLREPPTPGPLAFGADTADEDERRARGTHRTRRPGIGAADARARPQAELRRAPQAREEPARDARRAPGADRGGLRGHPGGGHRPAQVVGPLPRQAEGRDVHAADQASGRAHRRRSSCAPSASSRVEHGSDAGELSTRQTIQLHYLRLAGAARRLRAPRRGRADDRRRAAATPCATSPAAPSPAIAHDELFDATP